MLPQLLPVYIPNRGQFEVQADCVCYTHDSGSARDMAAVSGELCSQQMPDQSQVRYTGGGGRLADHDAPYMHCL